MIRIDPKKTVVSDLGIRPGYPSKKGETSRGYVSPFWYLTEFLKVSLGFYDSPSGVGAVWEPFDDPSMLISMLWVSFDQKALGAVMPAQGRAI